MPDPIARLEYCRQEVDRVFGAGHAAAHPELVSTVMLTVALDFAAIQLSAAIEQVALVLSEPETMPDNNANRARVLAAAPTLGDRQRVVSASRIECRALRAAAGACAINLACRCADIGAAGKTHPAPS